jgi:RNA polymerase sigma-70 factor, ECF subfamily
VGEIPTNFSGARLSLDREESDGDLVQRCLEGDSEAYRPLVVRYEKVLFNVAYRMVHDREDARDLAQGAFVKAFEKLSTFDRSRRFFSWIYRILLNDTLNFLEKRRPYRALDPGDDVAAPGGPLHELQARETERKVRAGLMELPVEQRDAVVLRYFAELSYAEMSAALEVPEKTVKSRLYSARQRLAGILGTAEGA